MIIINKTGSVPLPVLLIYKELESLMSVRADKHKRLSFLME